MIIDTISTNRSLQNAIHRLHLGKSGIISIDDKDGSELLNQETILNRIQEFYENLYSSNKSIEELRQATASGTIPRITEEEVKNVIKEMEKNKALGPDSIEIDVIKAVDESLESGLANLYTRCITL